MPVLVQAAVERFGLNERHREIAVLHVNPNQQLRIYLIIRIVTRIFEQFVDEQLVERLVGIVVNCLLKIVLNLLQINVALVQQLQKLNNHPTVISLIIIELRHLHPEIVSTFHQFAAGGVNLLSQAIVALVDKRRRQIDYLVYIGC